MMAVCAGETQSLVNDCSICPYPSVVSPLALQRDSPDDSMKVGAGMMQDKRMDMGSIGDYNGVMGKNPGPRHQLHKESAMDRSPYYDKVR